MDHHTRDQFPFAAVVGQDDAKLGLLLAAVDPRIGGVLLRGAKGSAKTTLARGLSDLLPGDAPFVELPLGATEDRVIGSIDLAAALTGGEVRFQPGLLAAAHGGVLYVDEVNLLADHLVDVLLDVAASGVNRVEREGVAHVHTSRFVLVGSMNPEEGELRPQFLDRFGLSVDVVADTDPDRRAEAVGRRLAFDADPGAFAARWSPAQDELRAQVGDAPAAAVSPELGLAVSTLCAEVGAESLRADLVTCRAAAALAGIEGRTDATVDDVRRVAPLALGHRRRRQPFEQPGIDAGAVDRALDSAHRDAPAAGPDAGGQDGSDPGGSEPDTADDGAPDGGRPTEAKPGRERVAAAAAPTRIVRLEATGSASGSEGRRSSAVGMRGRLVGDREPDGPLGSVAVASTVRAAATRAAATQAAAGPEAGSGAGRGPVIEAGDLRQAVRERRVGNLVVLVVDASGSMGAAQRMEAAKGAVMSLLLDAYQRRDRVAMVTFGGEEAEVALRPTGSVEVARARLADLPTGGRTPLAAGLVAAVELATSTGRHDDAERPLLVVVTDGRATAGPPSVDPVRAATEAATSVRRRGIAAVVVDVEEGPTRLGLAAELARAMGARHLTLDELSAGALTLAVRAACD
ncbi:MAG TPA: VWA domain-containing protein [Acidimicrobiales bacterium]|nr:VWA domain-containing protein [Acidimicrobiales bacterium]